MVKPLDQEVVDSWNEFFERFEKEIYPKIFLNRHVTWNDALILWTLNVMNSNLEAKDDDDSDEGWRE